MTDSHSNNHRVNTNTNDKTNIQTTSYKKAIKQQWIETTWLNNSRQIAQR